MSSTRFSTSSRGSGRTGSKVEQQLAREEAERQAVIRQQKQRAWRERQARKQHKKQRSTGTSNPKPSHKAAPSKPLRTTNGVTIDGNTFTVGGLRSQTKREQGFTIASVMSDKDMKALNNATRPKPKPSRRPAAVKTVKGAFAALDDSDSDSDTEEASTQRRPRPARQVQDVVFGNDTKSRLQQETSQLQWAGFRSGNPVAPVPAYKPQPKAAVVVLEHPDESESDSTTRRLWSLPLRPMASMRPTKSSVRSSPSRTSTTRTTALGKGPGTPTK